MCFANQIAYDIPTSKELDVKDKVVLSMPRYPGAGKDFAPEDLEQGVIVRVEDKKLIAFADGWLYSVSYMPSIHLSDEQIESFKQTFELLYAPSKNAPNN